MLKLRRPISINAHIMANELHSIWAKQAFLERQRQVLGQAHFQLTSQILDKMIKRWCPAKNVIHDDPSASQRVKNYTSCCRQILPRRVHFMDENDENDWTIDRSKWLDKVSLLRTIWSCKGKLVL